METNVNYWDKLQKYIDEIVENSDYSVRDVVDEIFYTFERDELSFEGMLGVIFSIYQNIAKDKMIKFYPNMQEKILDYEAPMIKDNKVWGYNLKDFDKKEVVDQVLKSWNIEV